MSWSDISSTVGQVSSTDIQQAIIDQAIDQWRVRLTAYIPQREADILNVVMFWHCTVCPRLCAFRYTMFYLNVRKAPFTRYNRLSNRLYNRFDNRLYRVNKHPTGCRTGCQTGLTTGLTTVLNERTVRSTRLSNRVDNRVERTATVRSTGCQTGLYNRFDNGFDNRLYRV